MDPKWKDPHFQEMAKSIGFVDKSDGEFFIEYNDFLSLFRSVSICTVEPEFVKDGVTHKSFSCSLKVKRPFLDPSTDSVKFIMSVIFTGSLDFG